MVALTTIGFLLAAGLLGIAGLEVTTEIPSKLFSVMSDILIPFLAYSLDVLLYLVTHFWITLGLIEIGALGMAIAEPDFFKMVEKWVSINLMAVKFFYQVFINILSFLSNMIPLIGGKLAGALS